MFAKNLSQSPASTIADDGSPYAPGSNEPSTYSRNRFGILQDAEGKCSTADRGSFRPNALVFRIQSESARLRETKTFFHLRIVVCATAVSSRVRRLPDRGMQRKLALSFRNGIPRLHSDDGFIGTAKVFPEDLQGRPRKKLALITASPKRPAKTSY
jgi:hypothetical protein